MRIAISSKGKELDSQIDEVFGRCPYFLIVEIKDKKPELIESAENLSANQMGGAGISAAQQVAEKEVKAIITGNVGPRALTVLKQFDIEMYKGEGSVKDALQKFIDGKLEKIER